MSDDLSPEEQAIYDAELAVAEKLVAEAMDPYAKRLNAEQLEDMHDMLLDVLLTHPNAAEILANMAKRAAPEQSGEVGPAAATEEGDVRRSDKA